MGGDGRVDQVTAQAAQPRKRPILVGGGEPAIADDVGYENRCELPGLAHCVPPRGNIAQLPMRERSIREWDIWVMRLE